MPCATVCTLGKKHNFEIFCRLHFTCRVSLCAPCADVCSLGKRQNVLFVHRVHFTCRVSPCVLWERNKMSKLAALCFYMPCVAVCGAVKTLIHAVCILHVVCTVCRALCILHAVCISQGPQLHSARPMFSADFVKCTLNSSALNRIIQMSPNRLQSTIKTSKNTRSNLVKYPQTH